MRVFLVVSFLLCILRNWNVNGFILHRVVSANNRPDEENLAKAITEDLRAIQRLAEVGDDDQHSSSLLVGVSWRATFVAKNSTSGRYLPESFGLQCFESDGSFTNTIRGIFRLKGTYNWVSDKVMQLDFQELQLLLGPFRPTINIREGQGIRSWIEKNIRGGKKKTKDFQKRANTYAWCHVDEKVCVAKGSSGSTALWVNADLDRGTDQ
mmetsp:Transcript_12432/g.16338  ORF Transcript_12432/g.16338 Transcript_12432/m.16338 type:complete len:209 (-) Transcript_12432:243-869(-)|eukprot:CAMPEP_0198145298 /NCGR_PEP_ID=MMETSP1443-20131203/22571_1 /TAXON_ID=186043 /ORGANISM="Entomoneis sp., Strain CCMP2396" /LENGTH=208 /DNA_ID=CAMNT_0043808897 /DNA_START=38 /DNA_END=664 /DNA_ORIENTATION=+